MSDPLNPNLKSLISFVLVHGKDTINCPMEVSRCHSCILKFQSTDIVVVKTQGQREWFDQKQGKLRKSSGNVYLHYLNKSKAVAQTSSVKKVFLVISQNSQENTFARVSFLIKLQAAPATFL